MKVSRAHKVRLDLNNNEANHLLRCCGISRLAYNWGISEWKRQHLVGNRPSAFSIKKSFNKIKRGKFPFVLEVTKCAPEEAFSDLGRAFSNFFRNIKQGKKPGYPRTKKKGKSYSFRIANDKIRTEGKKVRIPKLGWVRMREEWRFPLDKLLSATVSQTAGRWFISFSSEGVIENSKPSKEVIGVDVGIKEMAVTSDGEVFKAPRALRKHTRRIRSLQKAVSRKKRGSRRRKRAVLRLARKHARISNIRRDAIHKASHAITKVAGLVCIEDLHVKGMMKNHRLARSISDAALGELHRQIEYKAAWRGVSVVKADRWFPSSKTCSGCGFVKSKLLLSERTYRCSQCNLELDRDLNAALNLKNYAAGFAVKACRLGSSGFSFGGSETTDWAGTFHKSGATLE